MRYFLYVNHPTSRARMHREGCSFIKVHGGETRDPVQQRLWEEHATREGAFAALEHTGKNDRRACATCAP